MVKDSYRVWVKVARQKVCVFTIYGFHYREWFPTSKSHKKKVRDILFCPFRIDQIVKSELHMPEWSQTERVVAKTG